MTASGPKISVGAFAGMAPSAQLRPQQSPLPKLSTPLFGAGNSPNSPTANRVPRAGGPFAPQQQPQPQVQQQPAPNAKPNYFVGVGMGVGGVSSPNPAAAGTGIAPKSKVDPFANLLGSAGAKLGTGPGAAGFAAANAPKTIKDLVHAKEAKQMDPDEFKVHKCSGSACTSVSYVQYSVQCTVFPLDNSIGSRVGRREREEHPRDAVHSARDHLARKHSLASSWRRSTRQPG